MCVGFGACAQVYLPINSEEKSSAAEDVIIHTRTYIGRERERAEGRSRFISISCQRKEVKEREDSEKVLWCAGGSVRFTDVCGCFLIF